MDSRAEQYDVIKTLGRGTYGRCYKVQHRETGEILVLKAVSLQGLSEKDRTDTLNEARIMQQISHENIIRHVASWCENQWLFIVMEYAQEGDLGQVVASYADGAPALSEDMLLKYIADIAQGLKYLHANRILHRDIKPSNIFMVGSKAVIADLGLGRWLSSPTACAHSKVGTPLYFSPELCEERPYDEKSDVWAFGCLIYELATGCPPFTAANQVALARKIVTEDAPSLPCRYSPELQRLLGLMLEKDPAKRIAVADIFSFDIIATRKADVESARSCSGDDQVLQAVRAEFEALLAHERQQLENQYQEKLMHIERDMKQHAQSMLQAMEEKQHEATVRLEVALATAEEKLEELQGTYSKLQSDYASACNSNKELEDMKSRLESSQAQLREQIGVLEARLADADGTSAELRQQLCSEKASRTAVEQHIAGLSAEASRAKSLAVELSAKDDALARERKKLDMATSQLQAATEKVREYEQRIQTMQGGFCVSGCCSEGPVSADGCNGQSRRYNRTLSSAEGPAGNSGRDLTVLAADGGLQSSPNLCIESPEGFAEVARLSGASSFLLSSLTAGFGNSHDGQGIAGCSPCRGKGHDCGEQAQRGEGDMPGYVAVGGLVQVEGPATVPATGPAWAAGSTGAELGHRSAGRHEVPRLQLRCTQESGALGGGLRSPVGGPSNHDAEQAGDRPAGGPYDSLWPPFALGQGQGREERAAGEQQEQWLGSMPQASLPEASREDVPVHLMDYALTAMQRRACGNAVQQFRTGDPVPPPVLDENADARRFPAAPPASRFLGEHQGGLEEEEGHAEISGAQDAMRSLQQLLATSLYQTSQGAWRQSETTNSPGTSWDEGQPPSKEEEQCETPPEPSPAPSTCSSPKSNESYEKTCSSRCGVAESSFDAIVLCNVSGSEAQGTTSLPDESGFSLEDANSRADKCRNSMGLNVPPGQGEHQGKNPSQHQHDGEWRGAESAADAAGSAPSKEPVQVQRPVTTGSSPDCEDFVAQSGAKGVMSAALGAIATAGDWQVDGPSLGNGERGWPEREAAEDAGGTAGGFASLTPAQGVARARAISLSQLGITSGCDATPSLFFQVLLAWQRAPGGSASRADQAQVRGTLLEPVWGNRERYRISPGADSGLTLLFRPTASFPGHVRKLQARRGSRQVFARLDTAPTLSLPSGWFAVAAVLPHDQPAAARGVSSNNPVGELCEVIADFGASNPLQELFILRSEPRLRDALLQASDSGSCAGDPQELSAETDSCTSPRFPSRGSDPHHQLLQAAAPGAVGVPDSSLQSAEAAEVKSEARPANQRAQRRPVRSRSRPRTPRRSDSRGELHSAARAGANRSAQQARRGRSPVPAAQGQLGAKHRPGRGLAQGPSSTDPRMGHGSEPRGAEPAPFLLSSEQLMALLDRVSRQRAVTGADEAEDSVDLHPNAAHAECSWDRDPGNGVEAHSAHSDRDDLVLGDSLGQGECRSEVRSREGPSPHEKSSRGQSGASGTGSGKWIDRGGGDLGQAASHEPEALSGLTARLSQLNAIAEASRKVIDTFGSPDKRRSRSRRRRRSSSELACEIGGGPAAASFPTGAKGPGQRSADEPLPCTPREGQGVALVGDPSAREPLTPTNRASNCNTPDSPQGHSGAKLNREGENSPIAWRADPARVGRGSTPGPSSCCDASQSIDFDRLCQEASDRHEKLFAAVRCLGKSGRGREQTPGRAGRTPQASQRQPAGVNAESRAGKHSARAQAQRRLSSG